MQNDNKLENYYQLLEQKINEYLEQNKESKIKKIREMYSFIEKYISNYFPEYLQKYKQYREMSDFLDLFFRFEMYLIRKYDSRITEYIEHILNLDNINRDNIKEFIHKSFIYFLSRFNPDNVINFLNISNGKIEYS